MPQAHEPDVSTRAAVQGRDSTGNFAHNDVDRSILLFVMLLAITAFLATMLLVEDNLFKAAWRTLLSLLPGQAYQVSFAMISVIAIPAFQPR